MTQMPPEFDTVQMLDFSQIYSILSEDSLHTKNIIPDDTKKWHHLKLQSSVNSVKKLYF